MRIASNIPEFILEQRDPTTLQETNRNLGDMVLRKALYGMLRHHELVPLSRSAGQSFDAIVLAMANCIHDVSSTVAGATASLLTPHQCPKYLLSIGAQNKDYGPMSLNENSRFHLRRLFGQMDRIFVRGEYTKSVLLANELDYSFEIAGCPTSLALSPDLPAYPEVSADSHFLFHLPARPDVSPERYAQLQAVFREGDFDLVAQMHVGDVPHLGEFSVFYPFSLAEWTSRIKQSDLVLGTRIHGSVLSLSVGKPAICLCIDSRTTELCEMLGVPFLPFDDLPNPLTLAGLIEALQAVKVSPDRYRRQNAQLREAFSSLSWLDLNPVLN